MSDRIIFTKSYTETYSLGKELGFNIRKLNKNEGIKLGFTGDLGAGKTLMIKGIMSVLMPTEDVTSPTYTIINQYSINDKDILHVDLYRINSTAELEGTGFIEALSEPSTVMLIEWIDRLANEVDNLCKDIVYIDINYVSTDERKITIKNWR